MAHDTQMLKGVLEGCILGLLKDEAAYGYLIVEKLKEAGFENIGEATVYPILTRLQKRGVLGYDMRPSDIGPPRKYYYLSREGKRELGEFIKNYNALKDSVDAVFKEGQS